MDIRSRDIFIIFAIVIAFYFWWKVEPNAEPQGQEEVVAPKREQPREREWSELVENKEATRPESIVREVGAPESSKNPQVKYPGLDESFVPFDGKGNRYIEQVIKSGPHLIYHGDVLLGKTSDLPRLMKNDVIKQGKSRKWPQGVIPYVIDENLPNYEQVIDAIGYFNLQTNVRLVEREEQEDFVLITPGTEDCYSYAGRIGGKQEIFLTPRCGVREILHEMMHTLGFFHEQNREDRDQHVKIIWENIDERNHPQFKKLPNDFIGLTGRPFDFNSIMLYSSHTFSVSPHDPAMVTIHNEVIPEAQSLLSEEDIERVNLAYPKYQ